MILGFLMLSFKPAYSLSYFTLIKTLFSSSLLSAIRVVTSAYLKCWYFSKQSWFHLCFIQANIFFSFIFISWRLISLQYCSGFCHTLTWISHGFTCVPHPDPPSHLPLYPIPLGLPSAPGPSTCLMHSTWAGDLFLNILSRTFPLRFLTGSSLSTLSGAPLPFLLYTFSRGNLSLA